MRRKRIIGMKPKENGSKRTAPPCRGCGRGLIVTRKRHFGGVKRTVRLHGTGFSGIRKRLFRTVETWVLQCKKTYTTVYQRVVKTLKTRVFAHRNTHAGK